MKAYVYILKCSDGSYYTGTARNLELRISQHMQGFGSRYASSRLPVELVYAYECDSYGEALTHERQIKGWSQRKKEAMIRGDYSALVQLSKNRQKKQEDLSKDDPGEKFRPDRLFNIQPVILEGYAILFPRHAKWKSKSSLPAS